MKKLFIKSSLIFLLIIGLAASQLQNSALAEDFDICSISDLSYFELRNSGKKQRALFLNITLRSDKDLPVEVTVFNGQGVEITETYTIAGAKSRNITDPSAISPLDVAIFLRDHHPGGLYFARAKAKLGPVSIPCSPASIGLPQVGLPDGTYYTPEIPSAEDIESSSSLQDSEVGNLFNPVPRFSTLGEIMTSLIPSIFGLAFMLGFAFLVYGGIRFALSRGDAKAAESARGVITNTILGLFVILAVFVIFEIISIVLGFTVFSLIHAVHAGVNDPLNIGANFKIGSQSAGSLFPNFGTLFTRLIAAGVVFMGLIFFALLLWGGMRYMLSRGDEKAIASARGTLTNATIGLLIVLSAFAIITLIAIVTGQESVLPF